MKHLKQMFLVGCAAVMLASCSEEQTVFDIENVPGKAKIQGTVTYNEGTTLENGKFVYAYRPAANLKVFVQVDNSSYGNGLSGQTTFETVTDENGHYELTVSAPTNATSARVYTAQFEGVTTMVKNVDQKVTTVTENVVWGASTSASIQSYGIVYADMVCRTYSKENLPDQFNQYAPLTLTIGRNMEYKVPITATYDYNDKITGYRDAKVEYYFEPAPGADVILSVDYDGNSIYLNGTTDASGKCTFEVPVSTFPASFTYDVEILPMVGSFTHYERAENPSERTLPNGATVQVWDYEAKTLTGWYQQDSSMPNTSGYLNYALNSVKLSRDVKALVFQVMPETESYNYSTYYWNASTIWFSERDTETNY